MKYQMKTSFNYLFSAGALFLALSVTSCKKLTEETICTAPATVNVKSITDTSAVFDWPAAPESEQYIIRVVAAGSSWTGALEKRSAGTSTTITFDNLSPATSYLVKVLSNCAGSNSDFTAEFPFQTQSAKVFDLTKKWKINKLQSNGINLVTGSSDYAEFLSPDVYNQSLLGSPSNGTWNLTGPSLDTLVLNAGATRKYKIRTLTHDAFKGVGVGTIQGDTLEMTPF